MTRYQSSQAQVVIGISMLSSYGSIHILNCQTLDDLLCKKMLCFVAGRTARTNKIQLLIGPTNDIIIKMVQLFLHQA